MRVFKQTVLALTAVVGLSAALAAQAPAAAPAGVTPEAAAKFMGNWNLGMESPQGAMTMKLTVKDASGKVNGVITSDIAPDAQTISDVSKSGEALVLKYTLDFQGTPIPAKITLTPAGDKMNVEFDFADGQFTLPGTAAKVQ